MACGAVSAKTLSPEEALKRLQGSQVKAQAVNRLRIDPQLVHTATTAAGQPAVYVFSKPDEGYMLLSADDIAYPVLGYATSGTLNTENMPDQMKWWIEEYARQIEYAASHSNNQGSDIRPANEQRQAIAPMLQTAWDQGEPYNGLCPVVNGSRSYTGCVATAMSQIMYYWKYPAVGKGKISYNDDEGSGKRLTWDFTEHPFEWDKMRLTYINGKYTDEEANAVAVLMKSTGASVKMSYDAESSGALSLMTAQAFVKYFDYDPNVKHVLRSTVSPSQWDRMIYDNLVNVGPVLYGGGSMLGGGHSFVLDGYDGNGYYHFNWGWSEMSDGYYSLNALNPQSLGAGGGGGGGYNFTQDGVFGIQPPTGQPAVEQPKSIFQMGTLVGEMQGDVLNLELVDEGEPMWVNYNPETIKVQFGIIIEQQNVQNVEPVNLAINDTKFSLKPGYGANANMLRPKVDFAALNLGDGVYKVTMATLLDEEGATWQPMTHNYGCSNYVVVTKQGDNYTIEETRAPYYTIDSVEFEDGLYYGCLAKVKFTITNPHDIEISRGVAPMLYTEQGTLTFMGDGLFVTLQPHETITRTLVTDMYVMTNSFGGVYEDTDYLLTLFEESSYKIMAEEFLQKVTMHPNPGTPNVSVNPGLAIEGANRVLKVVNGQILNYYEVSNPESMRVTAKVTLNSGKVAYPIYVCLLTEPNEQGSMGVIDYKGDAVFMSQPGESIDIDETFNFKTAVPGVKYRLSLAYGLSSSLVPVSSNTLTFMVVDPMGIEDANTADASLSFDGTSVSAPGQYIEVFNLQGIKLAEGNDSVNLEGNAPGLYIARTANQSLKLTLK